MVYCTGMKAHERTLKALANRRRLAVIRFLKGRKGEPVGAIAKEIKLSFRSTSKHLAILAAADILDKEQHGLAMFYFVNRAMPRIAKLVVEAL